MAGMGGGAQVSMVQAATSHLALCTNCGLLDSAAAARCTRCGFPLHLRKPNSVRRTWALLIAAYVLYLPANLLPITVTRSIFGVQQDTILSGVAYLWSSGSWLIATVVFVASIAVPLLKLFSLTLLVVSVQRRWRLAPLGRTRLYRFLEAIGRWSMLDIFVVTILVALVQTQSLATIAPGSGVLAFAAVVVLSMLATMAFEPRLIWDPIGETQPQDQAQ
jgi:paraquat-inducible protein A